MLKFIPTIKQITNVSKGNDRKNRKLEGCYQSYISFFSTYHGTCEFQSWCNIDKRKWGWHKWNYKEITLKICPKISLFQNLLNYLIFTHTQGFKRFHSKVWKNPTFHVNAYLDINPLQATWKCQDVDEVEQLSEIFRMFSEC